MYVRFPLSDPLPRELRDFRDIHAGSTILVCGCGNSLNTLEQPERFLTIGVNDVGRKFQPDYLVVLNSRNQFSGDRFRYVAESRARAVFTQIDLGIAHPHIVRFSLGRRAGVDLDNPNVLPHTRNSPYVAIALALHMGATRIGVIGVDYTDHHFFARDGRHGLASSLRQIDAEYKALYEAWRKRGVEIYNLSAESRVTAFPKISVDELAGFPASAPALRLVSYSTTPVVGVPSILADCINARTSYACRALSGAVGYGNGMSFESDVVYTRQAATALELLGEADVVIAHNGRIAAQHMPAVAGRPVVTVAHNQLTNVDTRWADRGMPRAVVAQHFAALPEFESWSPVPNPMPLWDPEYRCSEKSDEITIAYTPANHFPVYPKGHPRYWHSKGWAATKSILESLAARYGVRVLMPHNGGVSHAEALAMKRQAHIVVDECVTGGYHRNSLEGLAAGAVVVNGIGIVPDVVDVLLRTAGDNAGIPFVPARIDTLEAVLTELIALGSAELQERGVRSRQWIERHWSFDRQWARYWEPLLDSALEGRRRPRVRNAPRTPAIATPSPVSLDAVTVVITMEERDTAVALEQSLASLGGLDHVVVVADIATAPFAADVAAKHGHRSIDVRGSLTQAMNAGATEAATPLLLWTVPGISLSCDFVRHAVQELDERSLDVLVPWTSLTDEDVTYSELAPAAGPILARRQFIETNGGIPEAAGGCGQQALLIQASLFGRFAVTRRQDQHLERSSRIRRAASAAEASVLRRMRSVGRRSRFRLLFGRSTTYEQFRSRPGTRPPRPESSLSRSRRRRLPTVAMQGVPPSQRI